MGEKHVRANPIVFRVLLCLVAVIIASSVGAAYYIQQLLTDKTDASFTADTKATSQSIIDNLHDYKATMLSARALLLSDETVSQPDWEAYFANQKTMENNPGLTSISYVEVVPHAKKQQFINEQRKVFGDQFTITPVGDRSEYAVVRLSAAAQNVSSSYGFDVFSTAERKAVYQRADAQNRPTGSRPLKFATGYYGFFVALPVKKPDMSTKGYVVGSFRAEDLISAVSRPVSNEFGVEVTDITERDRSISLFSTKNWGTTPNDLSRQDVLSFSGRVWQIEYRSPRGYEDSMINFAVPRSILVIAGAVCICMIMAYAIYERRHGATGQK